MGNNKTSLNGSGGASRQVFRLSPSLHFSRPKRRTSLFFTLRARLIASFLFVALAPTALFAYFDTRATQTALTNAANQALYSAARQTRDSLETFIKTRVYAINEESNNASLSAYLSLPPEKQRGSSDERSALAQLKSSYDKDYSLNNYIIAYVLLDKTGNVLLDTSTDNPDNSQPFMNLDKVDPSLFSLMLSSDRTYISSVIFSATFRTPVLYFVSSVKDNTRQVIGILAARYNAAAIQSIVDQNQELAGPQSFAVVYDGNMMRLTQGSASETIYKTVLPLDAASLADLQNIGRIPQGSDLSTNLTALADGLAQVDLNPYFTTKTAAADEAVNAAAALKLENKDWTVSYFQPQAVFLAPLQSQMRDTIFMALTIAAAATLLGIFITQRLTRPIGRLTLAAEKVASGDLWVQAPESQDEIGVLAAAFNTMTTELRRTLESLEQRIAERTSQLARASEQMKYRANQLQTVTEVAHVVASIQDPDELLPLITQLISERFGYYHTGIFLVDNNGEYAVLQAASSAGGQEMLRHNHKLKVGQEGIVGYVTGQGESRIALDVGEDAVFFDNPDLPNTRSEMALPLKIGDQIIGALDVQSEKPAAFGEEDVAVLNTMADQVAIAIQNARLFSETRRALADLQTLHGQYLQQQWSQAVIETGKSGYQYTGGKLEALPASGKYGLWNNVSSGEPAFVVTPSDEGEGKSSTSLVAPIIVRGQVIGVYSLGEPDHPGGWEEEDIEFVKSVADQVGLALENARLLEQTQKRAEREHLVAEITSKMRSSNDPQEILDTARRELLQALGANKVEIIPTGKAAAEKPSGDPANQPHKNDQKSGNNGKHEPGVRGGS
jgi:GAF domain-containing protein/HAMP domain-containing protein